MKRLSPYVKVLLLMTTIHSIRISVGSIVCLEGKYIGDPSNSNGTVTCGATEVCYIKKISTTSGLKYTMGCLENSLCSKNGDVILKPHFDVIGKRLLIEHRDELKCAKCCSGDECNRKLCQEDPRCTDRVPRDCSDPRALANICKHEVTAAFCVKSCKICPVDGGLSHWSIWTTCSCHNGTQMRHRSCTNPEPKYGGNNCTGNIQESRKCNTSACPIDGGFTKWSPWSLCSKTCGNGTQKRQRNCSNPTPLNGGDNCTGPNTENKQCNTKPCNQAVNGGFTDLSTWRTCSTSCGSGTQQQKRSCTNPIPKYDGKNCAGANRESRNCNMKLCPIDGGFTHWSRWSLCSRSCGGGEQRRQRSCTNPVPKYNGKNCTGYTHESRKCGINACPIDGGFTQWSQWNTCSKTCNSGTQMRQRHCSYPSPSNGGANCTGFYAETQQCNTKSCPQVCQDPFPECRCRFLNDNLGICSESDGTKEHFCCYYCKRKAGQYQCPDIECEIGEIEENHKVNSGSGTTFLCT